MENAELRALLEETWAKTVDNEDITGRLEAHSLGWVTARSDDGHLVGFVNVAWDGGLHAFLLDTSVAASAQRMGVGTQLVALATDHARQAGCNWLHVDFEPVLRSFYVDACGFRFTEAGLVDLTGAQ
jgi:GNAT superfamily N-acetyltransferase